MLTDHFGLSHFPFSDGAELNGLFECPQFESTYDALLMGVLDGRRIQVVVGSSGIGRTTALTRLRIGLQPSEFHVIPVELTNLNLEELNALILREAVELSAVHLGEDDEEFEAAQDQADSHSELRQRLRRLRESGHPVVVLIDDAENLGAPVLNQLPNLLKDEDEITLAQAVLTVRPEFAQRLTGIELDRLNAAIDGIHQLESWDRTTVTDYVCAAIESASGVAGDIFTEDAIEALFEHSSGLPARLNTLCGSAMREAEAQGKRRVSPEHVHAVAAGVLAAIDSASGDEPIFGDSLDLYDLANLSADGGERQTRRGNSASLFSRISTWRPTSKITLTPDRLRGRLPVLATGAVVVAGIATALLVTLADSEPRSQSREALQAATTPAFSGSKIVPVTRENTPVASTPHPQTVKLDELADTVRDLSRTLVSIEARLGSYESEMAGLKQAVRELESAPKTVLVKAQPNKSEDAAPTQRRPSARTVSASTKETTPVPLKKQPGRASANSEPSPVSTMASRTGQSHKVLRGDTLWGIANQYGITVNALAALNGVSPTATLKPGQSLQIVRGTDTARALSSWYTVQRGDSLYSIGKRFAVPPKNLAAWNCLSSGKTIFPGQRISIAQPGDTDGCTDRG